MFSQRSIMIGFIILIVACLVMYGCSSTSIKEGISNFGGNSAYYTSAKTGDGYIYSTEAEADAACKSVGWDGLCRKVDVPTKCACGWYAGATAADVGYHMDANTTHWGTGGCGGTSTDWITCAGKGGAYCCGDGPEVAALNPGYLPGDDLAHEGSNYIYKTQAEAEAACKAAGWDGLCKKKDVPSKCAAGWYAGATPDDVGYHMDPNTPGWGDVGCGDGSTGWIHYFPGGKAGAYCCGGGPKCPNLSGSWSSTTGGYTVKITQDNCDWTAISPSQPWSPARGKVSGTNLISSTPGLMPAAAGWTPAKLSGNPVNSIAWDDGDTWTRKSPPSSTRVFISGELIGIHLYTDQVQLWTPLGKAGGTINGPTEITNTAASPAFQNAQNNTLNSILIDKDTTFTMYSGENGTGKSWTRTGPILLWGGNGDVAGMCEGCADRWKQMGGSTTVGTQTAWNGKLDTSFYKDSTLPEGCMLEWMGEWCCKSSGGSFQITTPQGGNACVPGFDAVMAASYKKANKKEDCRNLCNNTSDCTYWGWWPQNITADDIQQSERSQMGFASSQDVPGACWLGSGSPSWTQTPTQSNTMYQKLCSWGGKKNCSFTNVSLAKRKGNGGCNNWADIKIREGTQDTSGPRTCEQECLAQKSPPCVSFQYGVNSSPPGQCILQSGSCDIGTNDAYDVYTPILCKSTTPPPPPKCPDGWEQVGGLGADIGGGGIGGGGARDTGRFDKNNIQQCADWCTAAGNQCKSFNWESPVTGECNDGDRAAGCRTGGTACTRYASDSLTNYNQNAAILCKPSAPPPKGCGSNCCTGGGDTVNGQCCCNSNTTCGGEDCSYYDDGSGGGGGGGGGVGSGTLSLGKNAILLNVDKYSKKL